MDVEANLPFALNFFLKVRKGLVNPPLFDKGGAEGIYGRAVVLGKTLAAGCGCANLRMIPQKVIDHLLFEQSLIFCFRISPFWATQG